MWPVIGGLIGGASSLLGSIFSSSTANSNNLANIAAQANQNLVNQGFAADMQKDTQNFNAQAMQEQRNYETQMSSTAYQRASADMQQAGLNPMMMFGSGGAASTPSVSAVGSPSNTVTGQAPVHAQSSPMAGIGTAVANAMTGAVQAKLMDKTTDEMANLVQENDLLKKKIDLTTGVTAKTEADKRVSEAEEELVRTRAGLLKQDMPAARVRAREAGAVENLPDWMISAAGVTKYGAGLGSQVMDVLSPAARILQGHSALEFSKKMQQGNFIGKYGTPIDEYLAQ